MEQRGYRGQRWRRGRREIGEEVTTSSMVWVEEGFKKIHKRVSVGLKRKGVGDCSESSHVFGLELQPEDQSLMWLFIWPLLPSEGKIQCFQYLKVIFSGLYGASSATKQSYKSNFIQLIHKQLKYSFCCFTRLLTVKVVMLQQSMKLCSFAIYISQIFLTHFLALCSTEHQF